MSEQKSLIADLEDAVQHGSTDARMDVLHRLTNLFLMRREEFTEEQIAHFDEVFLHLIDRIETRALIDLSERLARVDNAPRKVIRLLAHHDEIMVAGPVLANSYRVKESDLVAIVESKGQAHLLEISDRPWLEEPITDALVDRGNDEVLRNVAANVGARLSGTAFAALARRSESDDILARNVGQRPDVPLHVVCDLLSRASETVQQHLLASARPELREQIRQVVANISRDVALQAPAVRDHADALRAMASMYADGKPTEQEIRNLAQARRLEDVVAALSLICNVPIHVVDRIRWGRRIDAILVLCKVADFKWPTVDAVIQMASTRPPAPHDLAEARANYARLSQSNSHRVLQFWRDREGDWEDFFTHPDSTEPSASGRAPDALRAR
jgi:uncharacterized protein (DUF2336 family)